MRELARQSANYTLTPFDREHLLAEAAKIVDAGVIAFADYNRRQLFSGDVCHFHVGCARTELGAAWL